MRMRVIPAGTILGVLLLCGCVNQPQTSTPQPTASIGPVFASEEAALAAAVEAYEAYLAVSDQIAADGGANPERLKDLVTPEWYEKELEVIEMVREAGIRQVGITTSRNAELQQVGESAGTAQVMINVCADATATMFVDSAGSNITPENRIATVTNEVTFEASTRGLLIVQSEPWQVSSLC